MYVRGIYGSNIRLKYSWIMPILTIYFADINHETRWASTNMPNFLTNFNLEFLSNYKEFSHKTYIYKKVLTSAK